VREASCSVRAQRSSPRSGFATHDGAEIARRFGPQPAWIDEPVAAVTRLQGVHLVDITVDQNRGPIVVGKATTIHAIQRVRHSGRRTRSPRLLPQFWQLIGYCSANFAPVGRSMSGPIGRHRRTATSHSKLWRLTGSATMSYIGAPRRSRRRACRPTSSPNSLAHPLRSPGATPWPPARRPDLAHRS
jgi:hypothetical protein